MPSQALLHVCVKLLISSDSSSPHTTQPKKPQCHPHRHPYRSIIATPENAHVIQPATITKPTAYTPATSSLAPLSQLNAPVPITGSISSPSPSASSLNASSSPLSSRTMAPQSRPPGHEQQSSLSSCSDKNPLTPPLATNGQFPPRKRLRGQDATHDTSAKKQPSYP